MPESFSLWWELSGDPQYVLGGVWTCYWHTSRLCLHIEQKYTQHRHNHPWWLPPPLPLNGSVGPAPLPTRGGGSARCALPPAQSTRQFLPRLHRMWLRPRLHQMWLHQMWLWPHHVITSLLYENFQFQNGWGPAGTMMVVSLTLLALLPQIVGANASSINAVAVFWRRTWSSAFARSRSLCQTSLLGRARWRSRWLWPLTGCLMGLIVVALVSSPMHSSIRQTDGMVCCVRSLTWWRRMIHISFTGQSGTKTRDTLALRWLLIGFCQQIGGVLYPTNWKDRTACNSVNIINLTY